jgi:hypothetical protein
MVPVAGVAGSALATLAGLAKDENKPPWGCCCCWLTEPESEEPVPKLQKIKRNGLVQTFLLKHSRSLSFANKNRGCLNLGSGHLALVIDPLFIMEAFRKHISH